MCALFRLASAGQLRACESAEDAILNKGHKVVILSDRAISPTRVAATSLLAAGAVHQVRARCQGYLIASELACFTRVPLFANAASPCVTLRPPACMCMHACVHACMRASMRARSTW